MRKKALPSYEDQEFESRDLAYKQSRDRQADITKKSKAVSRRNSAAKKLLSVGKPILEKK